MKYQKAHKYVDEREKLRKFRELDDAFAQALRQLEDPSNSFDIPTGPPVRSLQDLEDQDKASQAQAREHLFGERLGVLCAEYGYSSDTVKSLVETLLTYGRWALDETPPITEPSLHSDLSGSDKSAD
ncbi:hypothetical protein [Vreelandella sp. EE22]